jgi:hypothetical protein
VEYVALIIELSVQIVDAASCIAPHKELLNIEILELALFVKEFAAVKSFNFPHFSNCLGSFIVIEVLISNHQLHISF